MPELNDLFAEEAELVVANDGRPFTIRYRPGCWPVRWHVRVAEQQLPYAEVVERLALVLTGWDLTHAGAPLPCDAEALWSLPRRAIAAIYNGIFFAEMGMTPDEGDDAGKVERGGRPGTRS